ncbi:Retrovirus-related Pol polyprotein from transposon TNT 1-94 [Bienertia sinuspersici]
MSIDIHSPVYLHPSESVTSLAVEKLQGPSDYRAWRRSMEISLAAKRKLGFVIGSVKKDKDDAQKAEQWDTCDSMVIAWIHASVSEQIKKSILYAKTSSEAWRQFELTFNVANGSRKYRVDKEMLDTQQSGGTIHEYYTKMKALWEEEDAMNVLPPITNLTPKIDAFIGALNTQKAEKRLFQFLNGVDEDYAGMRTQMLMKTPLPTVEEACASIQQEEIQNEVFKMSKLNIESAAMISQKQNEAGCSACGGKGHTKDRCRTVIGYPKWHPKYKKQQKTLGKEMKDGGAKFGRGRGQKKGMAAAAKGENTLPMLTKEQVEQLLKLIPGSSKGGSETGNR